jgi:hypothetical protein
MKPRLVLTGRESGSVTLTRPVGFAGTTSGWMRRRPVGVRPRSRCGASHLALAQLLGLDGVALERVLLAQAALGFGKPRLAGAARMLTFGLLCLELASGLAQPVAPLAPGPQPCGQLIAAALAVDLVVGRVGRGGVVEDLAREQSASDSSSGFVAVPTSSPGASVWLSRPVFSGTNLLALNVAPCGSPRTVASSTDCYFPSCPRTAEDRRPRHPCQPVEFALLGQSALAVVALALLFVTHALALDPFSDGGVLLAFDRNCRLGAQACVPVLVPLDAR